MIVVMRPDATREQVDDVCRRVREMGLRDQPIAGSDLWVIAAIGEDRKKDPDVFEHVPGVERAIRVLAPYKLASRKDPDSATAVAIGPDWATGGDTGVAVVAGPCSVESRDQILESARRAQAAGAVGLRGGAFKPRTNPYSFQGLGKEGLELLGEARAVTGLAVITEVLAPADVDLVSGYADCLQVGARNAQNFRLLDAVGRSGKPVLLKRGMSMTVEETLQAAEYVLAAGNPNVVICERGVRTFEAHARNTLSLSAAVELKQRSHLPVWVDPSQGTGHAHLVPAMCRAAVAAGIDGLLIEMHPDPAHALTDGAQSITPDTLDELMPLLARLAEATGRSLQGVRSG